MDAVSHSPAAASIDAVNRVLEQTTRAQLQLSEKMMKVNVTMKLGSESGKGAAIDQLA